MGAEVPVSARRRDIHVSWHERANVIRSSPIRERERVMIAIKDVRNFVEGIYQKNERGLIHGVEHTERLVKDAVKLAQPYAGEYDSEILELAGMMHGVVHYGEENIRNWLIEQGLVTEHVERIITVAWESQAKSIPVTLEGMILHDAHYVEGGKEFHVLKPIIVGTEMGQSLDKTIEYMKSSMMESPVCFLPESKELFNEIHQYTIDFICNLEKKLYVE